VFAKIFFIAYNSSMDLTETRRARLTEWFAHRSIPEAEKSYLSQLKSGKSSFGEKAARRLERDYGMPTHYLDGMESQERSKPPGSVSIAPTAVTLDLPADCLVVWELLQRLAPEDQEKWRASLEYKVARTRMKELGMQTEDPPDIPLPKDGQTKLA
jgi:hypothetical protein